MMPALSVCDRVLVIIRMCSISLLYLLSGRRVPIGLSPKKYLDFTPRTKYLGIILALESLAREYAT